MSKAEKKILIVEARFYEEIADALATGAGRNALRGTL